MNSDFAIRFEWLDGEALEGPELAATFARLEIRVDDVRATRVFDRQSRTERDAIYVPLYPLAEWFAWHWWRLWFEPENRRNSSDFAEAHDLSRADRAYALPRLTLVSAGASTRIAIERRALAFQSLDFREDGDHWVETDRLRAEVTRFVDAVRERLRVQGVGPTLLESVVDRRRDQEKDRIQAQFCRTAASLGLDPDAVPNETADNIEQAIRKLPCETLEDLSTSVEPAFLLDGVAWIERAWNTLKSKRPQVRCDSRSFARELREAARSVPIHRQSSSWQRGYAVADAVERAANLLGMEPASRLESLLDRLAIGDGVEQLSRVHGIAAISLESEENGPRIGVTPHNKTGRRFAAARALYHFLVGGSKEPRLATRAETERQKASRAFAAELLAPAKAIERQLVGDRVLDWSDVEDIAEIFQVSSEVVRHQIENHHLARIAS